MREQTKDRLRRWGILAPSNETPKQRREGLLVGAGIACITVLVLSVFEGIAARLMES